MIINKKQLTEVVSTTLPMEKFVEFNIIKKEKNVHPPRFRWVFAPSFLGLIACFAGVRGHYQNK